jgi:hypothetical protein
VLPLVQNPTASWHQSLTKKKKEKTKTQGIDEDSRRAARQDGFSLCQVGQLACASKIN